MHIKYQPMARNQAKLFIPTRLFYSKAFIIQWGENRKWLISTLSKNSVNIYLAQHNSNALIFKFSRVLEWRIKGYSVK